MTRRPPAPSRRRPTGWSIPTVQEEPRSPGVVVVNPSDAAVEVDVSFVGTDGSPEPEGASVTVGPGRVASVPAAVLRRAPDASVLVRADGPIVALGASTSSGAQGVALYALAIGVPVPTWVFP